MFSFYSALNEVYFAVWVSPVVQSSPVIVPTPQVHSTFLFEYARSMQSAVTPCQQLQDKIHSFCAFSNVISDLLLQ